MTNGLSYTTSVRQHLESRALVPSRHSPDTHPGCSVRTSLLRAVLPSLGVCPLSRDIWCPSDVPAAPRTRVSKCGISLHAHRCPPSKSRARCGPLHGAQSPPRQALQAHSLVVAKTVWSDGGVLLDRAFKSVIIQLLLPCL